MLVSPSAHGARDIAHKKPTDKVLTASEELGLRLFLKHQVRFARVRLAGKLQASESSKKDVARTSIPKNPTGKRLRVF